MRQTQCSTPIDAQVLAAPLAPRIGTKLAKAIEMLRATEGATVAELSQAMGWLPHTTRAVLTGLRNRGYALTLDRSDAERSSAYRIALEASAGLTGTALAAIEPPIGESIDRAPDSATSPASSTAKRRSGATRTPRAA
jgi:Protein of unknown function (DUF3489)